MKKFDDLVKKVELFEKLAVYGDRKSFLKAIAQKTDVPNLEDPPSGNLWDQAKNSNIGDNSIELDDPNYKSYSLYDPQQVIPGVPNVGMFPDIKQNVGNSSIDPYVQKALHYLGAPGGLNTDGIRGPKTNNAITWFKGNNNLTGAADPKVFNEIKQQFQQKFPGLQVSYNDPNYSDKQKEQNPNNLPFDIEQREMDAKKEDAARRNT